MAEPPASPMQDLPLSSSPFPEVGPETKSRFLQRLFDWQKVELSDTIDNAKTMLQSLIFASKQLETGPMLPDSIDSEGAHTASCSETVGSAKEEKTLYHFSRNKHQRKKLRITRLAALLIHGAGGFMLTIYCNKCLNYSFNKPEVK